MRGSRLLPGLTLVLLAPMCGKDEETETLPDGTTTSTGIPWSTTTTGTTTDVTTTENLDCQIAWIGWESGQGYQVWLASPDGQSRVDLSDPDPGEEIFEYALEFSPDGTQLAWARTYLPIAGVNETQNQLIVSTLDGNRTQVTTGSELLIQMTTLHWSGDGTQLGMIAQAGRFGDFYGTGQVLQVDRSTDVFTVATDGTGFTNHSNTPGDTLSSHNAQEFWMAMSPTGNQLAYNGDPDDDGWLELFLDPGSGSPTELGDAYHGDYPQFTPDGTQVLTSGSGLQLHAVDGSGVTDLGIPGGAARISPDGTMIAYLRGAQLWVADIDGTNERQLASEITGSIYDPIRWASPDRVLFPVGSELRSARVDGSASTLIASDVEYSFAVSPHCF